MPTVFVNNSAQTGGVNSTVNSASDAGGRYFYGYLYNDNGTYLAYDHTTSLVYYMGLGADSIGVDGTALLTAGNTLYIDGGGGTDSLTAGLGVVTTDFTMTNSALTTSVANFQNFEVYNVTLGSGNDTVTLTGAAGDTVALSDGNDTVKVTSSRGTSSFNGGTGLNTLSVLNGSQSVGVNSTISCASGYFYGFFYNVDGGYIAYDKFQKITYGMGSGNDTLNLDGTSLTTAGSVVSVNGNGGTDTLNANLGVMTANLTMTDSSLAGGNVSLTNFEYYNVTLGSGNDTVTRTGGAGDNILLAGGNDSVTVTNSRATSSYNLGAGFNTLAVDNSAQATGVASTISSGSGYFYGYLYNADGGYLGYDKVQSLTYKMGSGNDALSFDGTSLATAGNGISVDAGGGSDGLTAGLGGMTANLTMTDHAITGGNVSLTGFDTYNVTLGSGNNTITLTHATGDTITLGSGDDTATITDSRGTSSFAFADGFNTLTVDNGSQGVGVSSSFNSANGYFYGYLYNDDGGYLGYDRADVLTYTMGSGSDTVNLDGASLAAAGASVTIEAGAGTDRLNANLSVMTSALTITDHSVTGSNVSLTGFDSYGLTTGAGADSLTLNGMGGSSFTLNGGGDSFELTNNLGGTSVDMGEGFDALTLDNSVQTVGVTSTINSASGYFYGYFYNDSGYMAYDHTEAIVYSMGSGNDVLNFSSASMLGTADTVSVDAGSGSDYLSANLAGLNTNYVMTDGSVKTDRLSLTGFETYNLDFGNGNDSVTLSHGDNDSLRLRGGGDSVTISDVRTSNTVDGGDGLDSLTINNSVQTHGVTSTINSASGHFYGYLYNDAGAYTTYDNIERLNYSMGSGDDTVNFSGGSLSTAKSQVKVNAGAGFDTLNADLSTAGFGVVVNPTSVHGGNVLLAGFETFNITFGNFGDAVYLINGAAGDVLTLNGGNDSVTLLDTHGNISVNGGAGLDTLKINNGHETVGVTSTINSADGHFYGNLYNDTGGNVSFDQTEILVYAAGQGNDTVNVDASSLATSGDVLYLDGGMGTDTLNINLSALGPLTLYYSNGTWAFGSNKLVHFETINFNFGSNAATVALDAAGNNFSSGAGNDSINGGGGNDVLRGNAGNDLINGGTGADNMYGGSGDDTYFVDDAGDKAQEQTTFGVDDGGTDTVKSSVTFALGTFVENLVLTGSAAIGGSGNSGNNIINGNGANNTLRGLGGDDSLLGGAGNDTLWGGAGNDSLNGGAGNDTFMFDAAGVANGIDHIADFAGVDRLAFKGSDFGFAAGHVLTAAEYHTGAAAGTNGQFLYDAASHTLSWDADGTGAGAAVAIAVFDNNATPALSSFLFV